MTLASFLRALIKGWLYSFLVFGLLAFLLVGQFVWASSQEWTIALRIAGRDWLFWAIVTPLIFQLVTNLPLGRSRWKIALPVHLFCAVLFVMAGNWWAEHVFPRIDHGPERRGFYGPGSFPPGLGERHHPPGPPGAAGPHFGPGPPHGVPWTTVFLIGFRSPTYLAILCAAHALHFYRRSQERERLESSLAKARLEALKMQLQPHFLFNSLNAIAALVHKDTDAAEEMLAALADLLRLTLETSGDQELPLSRELEFVERYLAIEHVRFGDRLRFTLEIAPETRAAIVPTFVLQPLVENAVRHGLEPRSGEGMLTVTAARCGETLLLTIADNGVGLAGGAPPHEGIGLRNTRERLRGLYGDAATLTLRNANGLRVELTVPFRTAP